MARTVKHVSLHRIAAPPVGDRQVERTELRVIADVESGVWPVIQVEEQVVRGYASRPTWPHRWVTLFILQDLQPLINQLGAEGDLASVRARAGAESLPPGGRAALAERPVLNVYDLADLANCHVFVNQRAMIAQGYWDDALAIQGLLAHEHAHPLAENETTRASRRWRIRMQVDGFATTDRQERVQSLLNLLAEKLALYAPRELFANEVTLHNGFGAALLHLNRRNMANVLRSVAGREDLLRHLQQEREQGELSAAEADLLLLIGDLRAYLELALEVASFYHAGQTSAAQEMEGVLEREVFPLLDRRVGEAYLALRAHYLTLRPDLTASEVKEWGGGVLDILAQALASPGAEVRYQWHTVRAAVHSTAG